MQTSIINKIKKINNKNILYLLNIGQKKFSYEILCSNFGLRSRKSILGNGKTLAKEDPAMKHCIVTIPISAVSTKVLIIM